MLCVLRVHFLETKCWIWFLSSRAATVGFQTSWSMRMDSQGHLRHLGWGEPLLSQRVSLVSSSLPNKAKYTVTNHKGHKILPTHIGEHSHYSRLPLPMWRVHPKGYAHHLSHPFFHTPPNLLPRLQVARCHSFSWCICDGLDRGPPYLLAPCPWWEFAGSCVETSDCLLLQTFPCPRWWAGYANPCPSAQSSTRR